MTGTYHHVNLLSRMPSLRGRPAHYSVYDLRVERVVSLSIETDHESGIVHCLLSIDYLSGDQDPAGDRLAIYPFSQQKEASEDAAKVASELGYRLRRATPGVGWEWVQGGVVLDPGKGDDLVIGA